MYDAGMTSRTAFILSTDPERFHVSAMTHDQPHLFYRRRKIAWRCLRHTKDMPMTAETDSGIHFGLEIVRIGRRPEYIDSRVFDSRQDLVG